MIRVCYWCGKHMGQKGDNHADKVFHSVCDDCASRLRLDERLFELLWAIVDLRKQNSANRKNQKLNLLPTAQHTAQPTAQ